MNKEAAKILYDIDLCARFTEKVAKNGHKYLRVDYEDFTKDISSGRMMGTTCFLVFVNEDNIKIKEYQYRFYRPRNLNINKQHYAFDKVKKLFIVGEVFRLGHFTSKSSLMFTKTKSGSKRVLIKFGQKVTRGANGKCFKKGRTITKTYDITKGFRQKTYLQYLGIMVDRLFDSRPLKDNPVLGYITPGYKSYLGAPKKVVDERAICNKIVVDKVMDFVNEHWDNIGSLKVKHGKKRKISRKSK